MRGNHPNNVFARNPGALQRPFAGIPLYRDAHTVLGWTDKQKVDWNLANRLLDLPALVERLASACAGLGRANRLRGPMRRYWQGKAFQSINAARRSISAAKRALAAAQAAVASLAPVPSAAQQCLAV